MSATQLRRDCNAAPALRSIAGGQACHPTSRSTTICRWPARLRPLALVLCVPACLPGCQAWQRRDVANLGPAPTLVVSGRHPVRVTRADGSTLVLTRAGVEGDSLVGEVGAPPRRAAVALTDVRRVEERRVSGPRTALLVAGVAVATFVVLLAAAAAALSDWGDY